MITLNNIEAAFTQSIKSLDDLLQDISYELDLMEFEEGEYVCHSEFLIGLDDLIEAVGFFENKRYNIRKLIK